MFGMGFDYIIVDRTPVTDHANDFVCRQVVAPGTYSGSIPCWIFNKSHFLSRFSEFYKPLFSFSSDFSNITVEKTRVEFGGFFFIKKV
jgi:hypothetical protein